MGCDASRPRMVEREHLRAAPARARLLRAFPAAGAAGVAGVRGDAESDPLLQPAVPVDVRPRGHRHVRVRARADRRRRRGVRCGPGVRVHTVPHRVGAAPAGALVGVDAVRAPRLSAVFQDGSRRAARRRRRGVGAAESFVRLLPAVLQPDRARVHRVGADAQQQVARSPRAGSRRDRLRGRRRRHCAVSAAVHRVAPARLQPAVARRDAALLGGRVRIPHGRSESAVMGTDRTGMAARRGRTVSGVDDRDSGDCWRLARRRQA